MKRALILQDRCTGCVPCLIEKGCERNAVIRETENEKPWIDLYLCSGCMKCAGLCPYEAVDEISQPCSGKGRKGW